MLIWVYTIFTIAPFIGLFGPYFIDNKKVQEQFYILTKKRKALTGYLKNMFDIKNSLKLISVFSVSLFDLILYVPSTIFQLNRDGSSWVEPVLS